jgi:UDP:flavonoid glycosyltransferase YjiC (YdhE family)
VVVTHAGHSTACYALAMGVPLVCMPMGRDQFMVADRVATVGAGVVVAQEAAPEAISDSRLLAKLADYISVPAESWNGVEH